MMLDESPMKSLLSMPPRAFTAPNDDAPLTRVSLLYIEQRINLYLRFGCPLRVHQIDRWRRCAVFSPAQLFCRIRWESNDYGTTRWQLIVLRSGRPEERMQRVRGVRPGCQWPFILTHLWPIKLTHPAWFNRSFSASVDSSLLPA